jgi:hypothetical protein
VRWGAKGCQAAWRHSDAGWALHHCRNAYTLLNASGNAFNENLTLPSRATSCLTVLKCIKCYILATVCPFLLSLSRKASRGVLEACLVLGYECVDLRHALLGTSFSRQQAKCLANGRPYRPGCTDFGCRNPATANHAARAARAQTLATLSFALYFCR